MSSHRAVTRAAALLAAAAALLLAAAPGARAQAPEQKTRRIAIIVLPEAEARTVLSSRTFGVGLGVFPSSRDPRRFVLEIGNNAPAIEHDPLLENLNLAITLQQFGVFTLTGSIHGDPQIGDALRAVFPASATRPGPEARGIVQIFQLERAEDAEVVFGTRAGVYLVLGFGKETPLLVGLSSDAFRQGGENGILDGGIARRPGIVTPYDVAATILDQLGIAGTDANAGSALTMEPATDARGKVDALAGRLLRDVEYAPGLAAVTVSLGVGSIIVALILMGLGRYNVALRVARGAVFVLPGWIVAVFIPSGRWEVRSIAVVAAVVLGAALRPGVDPVRSVVRAGFGVAIVWAAIVALAPLNPGGEPGMSIWGNPLTSWRFFGLQNVPAAIIASGVVVWGVLAGVRPAPLAAVAAAAAVITGAPAIGANFVGVLTFLLGASLAISALARRRAEVWQFFVAGAIAAGGFALALLADAGSPVSHGGRAVQKISNGGWAEAFDIVARRIRLNFELIGDFGGGPLWTAGIVLTLAGLITWGIHVGEGPLRGRVAVLAGAVMAFASLVLEDSGFYSGAVLWFVAVDAWLLLRLAREPGSGLTPSSTPAPTDAAG